MKMALRKLTVNIEISYRSGKYVPISDLKFPLRISIFYSEYLISKQPISNYSGFA